MYRGNMYEPVPKMTAKMVTPNKSFTTVIKSIEIMRKLLKY